MIRLRIGYPTLVAGLLFAAAAFAQPAPTVSDRYDPAAEITVKGSIVGVISTVGVADIVGVHMDVKTASGIVKVHVAPAMFIGEQNFWFECDEEVQVTGAMVAGGGSAALWAREITKANGKTLKVRDDRGLPLWKVDGQTDPDGCGVAHAVVR